jgi:hypothetical protein
MISRDEAERIVDGGGQAVTQDGDDLGSVVRIFLDEYTSWPSFMTVQLDQTSAHETFIALHEASADGADAVVPYDRERVHNAPTVSAGQDLSLGEEDELFDYYGVPIEGVEPSVAHLGSALVPTEEGVDEEPIRHPA